LCDTWFLLEGIGGVLHGLFAVPERKKRKKKSVRRLLVPTYDYSILRKLFSCGAFTPQSYIFSYASLIGRTEALAILKVLM
jgi:hypothetical protein